MARINFFVKWRPLCRSLALGGFLLGWVGAGLARPQVAQAPEMKGCEYLQQVTGNSGYGKDLAWQRSAKYMAFAQAEKLTATHVVWVRVEEVGAFNGVAVAKAYRCEGVQEAER